jgi:hypothetical protein
MDKLMRTEILEEVRNAVRIAMEGVSEEWVTGEELSKQYQMFTRAWLRRYGETLPRTRAVVTCKDGKSHGSVWCYPRHRIGRLIEEGRIRHLKQL